MPLSPGGPDCPERANPVVSTDTAAEPRWRATATTTGPTGVGSRHGSEADKRHDSSQPNGAPVNTDPAQSEPTPDRRAVACASGDTRRTQAVTRWRWRKTGAVSTGDPANTPTSGAGEDDEGDENDEKDRPRHECALERRRPGQERHGADGGGGPERRQRADDEGARPGEPPDAEAERAGWRCRRTWSRLT